MYAVPYNCLSIRRRVPLVEKELLTRPKHLNTPPVTFCSIHVAQYLVFCVTCFRSIIVLFLWSLYCLSVFVWRLLVSLNSSFNILDMYIIIYNTQGMYALILNYINCSILSTSTDTSTEIKELFNLWSLVYGNVDIELSAHDAFLELPSKSND
jgi:hypothetical protein